jgi:hypothetical protein
MLPAYKHLDPDFLFPPLEILGAIRVKEYRYDDKGSSIPQTSPIISSAYFQALENTVIS